MLKYKPGHGFVVQYVQIKLWRKPKGIDWKRHLKNALAWKNMLPFVNVRNVKTGDIYRYTSWSCFKGSQTKSFCAGWHHNQVSFTKHLLYLVKAWNINPRKSQRKNKFPFCLTIIIRKVNSYSSGEFEETTTDIPPSILLFTKDKHRHTGWNCFTPNPSVHAGIAIKSASWNIFTDLKVVNPRYSFLAHYELNISKSRCDGVNWNHKFCL